MLKRLSVNRIILLKSTLILLLISVLSPIPAYAIFGQPPTPSDDDVNEIARKLYCPVCENTPLDICDTQACRQWRGLIRQKLYEGQTEDQIIQYFTDTYGVRVLAAPPAEGFTLIVYLIPPALFSLAVVIVFRLLNKWKHGNLAPEINPDSPKKDAPDTEAYITLFENELRKITTRDNG